jgi:hypothetical protein
MTAVRPVNNALCVNSGRELNSVQDPRTRKILFTLARD